MPSGKRRSSWSASSRRVPLGNARLPFPTMIRRNEQVTGVYQASLERMGGEGRPADGEVSRRRGFHPLDRLGREMLLNTGSGSGCGLQSLGVNHLVGGPPYIREIGNEGLLVICR